MKKKHLETNFIKFIAEKYKKEIQELPDEETNVSNKEIVDEFDEIINNKEIKKDEVQDETENEDDLLEDLIKEYNQLQKKYKLKTNGLYNKRQ
jgi:BioD-like phosphotransacetylase family protein